MTIQNANGTIYPSLDGQTNSISSIVLSQEKPSLNIDLKAYTNMVTQTMEGNHADHMPYQNASNASKATVRYAQNAAPSTILPRQIQDKTDFIDLMRTDTDTIFHYPETDPNNGPVISSLSEMKFEYYENSIDSTTLPSRISNESRISSLC